MLIVQKYGGTSVGSVERIRSVARHVAATHQAGHQVVVVVSAMSGETDRLLKLLTAVHHDASERESDVVVSTGEQVTAGLMANAIQARGVPAVSLLAHQIPIVTDGIFCRARIQWINDGTVREQLAAGHVVVVPGFQGVDATGNLTTLGRGGSDTTAVAVAAALHADSCEIYTDVDGIYTTDPRWVPQARKIDRMAYEELLEMAGAGAKVMQMRSVQLAARYEIPLHVRSSIHLERPGTWVTPDDQAHSAGEGGTRPALPGGGASSGFAAARSKTEGFAESMTRAPVIDPRMEATLVSGITFTMNEAKIAVRRVPDRPGVAARLFDPLARANINVDMIVATIDPSGQSEIGFTVTKEDLKKTLQITEAAARDIGAQRVEAAGDVSKISIIGVGMRSHAGVAARLFDVLATEKINMQLISTSEIKVSVVVDMAEAKRAVRALHTAFGLDHVPAA